MLDKKARNQNDAAGIIIALEANLYLPRIGGTFLGVLIIRIIVFGAILGFPYFGKLPNSVLASWLSASC